MGGRVRVVASPAPLIRSCRAPVPVTDVIFALINVTSSRLMTFRLNISARRSPAIDLRGQSLPAIRRKLSILNDGRIVRLDPSVNSAIEIQTKVRRPIFREIATSNEQIFGLYLFQLCDVGLFFGVRQKSGLQRVPAPWSFGVRQRIHDGSFGHHDHPVAKPLLLGDEIQHLTSYLGIIRRQKYRTPA